MFWNNHDLPRIVSRWGNDKEYRVESAKLLATILHGMQGTPYIYQGEELGMTNSKFTLEQYRDIETINMIKDRRERGYSDDSILASLYAKSRDNARTPMQWDDSLNAGFTTGTPWLDVNPNSKEINAKSQMEDPDSIFSYYKNLIALRKEYPVFVEGDFELVFPENNQLFSYTRTFEGKTLWVLCNFYGNEVSIEIPQELKGEKKLLISNYQDVNSENVLRPYEARMYYL